MKKSMTKQLLAVLLALALVLSLVPAVLAQDAGKLADPDEIVIYYTNDVHTYIDGALSYDNLAALKTATAEQAAGVLLVDAGDHVQGTAYGSMDKGETIVDLMTAAGYDAATLGNHEFDYGMARLLDLIDLAGYPYLSANFFHEKDGVRGENVLDAYQIFEVGGKKIAILGVTTPESFTKSTPAYFMDENGNYIYGIAGGEDGSALYADVQKAIDAAAADGADYIIGLGHLGVDPASRPWTSQELIANTTGLDAFIDGHSHSTVPCEEVTDKGGNDVLLTQTGSYLDSVGRLSIRDGQLSATLVTEYPEADPAVTEIKDSWMNEVTGLLGEVIGYSDVVLDNYDEEGGRLVRKQETNTGDFCADALYYLFDQTKDMDVDVAIMNGGGVRNKAVTGELSYLSCKSIHTFGNVACLQTVTGQQILDALEWGARDVGIAECGGFLQVSGLTYEIHTYIPSGCQKDDKGVWTGHVGPYRVQNVQVLNKETGSYEPLDLTASYNLAGYNYTLRDLGDGFAMFQGAVNVLDYVMEDYQVLANYVKSFPVDETTGLPTITVENSPYGDVRGNSRITNVSFFPDVEETRFSYDAIRYVREKGYMLGTQPTTFSPEGTMSRAMAVAVLYRMAGEPDASGMVHPFYDVEENEYYTDAIAWAYHEGVVLGYDDGTFAPHDNVTRAQLVTFLYRYARKVAGDPSTIGVSGDLSGYADGASVPPYARIPMAWATAQGVLLGHTDGSLAPYADCTREQFAAIVYRYEA